MDHDEAMSVLRKEYYGEVAEIAENFIEEAKRHAFDADDAERWLQETIDGCQRVIYTHKAMCGLLVSDNDDAYVENFGADGIVQNGSINWSGLMYAALKADVVAHLDAMGVSVSDPDTWKEATEEAASEEGEA